MANWEKMRGSGKYKNGIILRTVKALSFGEVYKQWIQHLESALTSIFYFLFFKNGSYNYANVITSSLMSQSKGAKSGKSLMLLEDD